MEHQGMEEVLVPIKQRANNGFEDDCEIEESVETISPEIHHTESCPEGCCKFVTRYFLKVA